MIIYLEYLIYQAQLDHVLIQVKQNLGNFTIPKTLIEKNKFDFEYWNEFEK